MEPNEEFDELMKKILTGDQWEREEAERELLPIIEEVYRRFMIRHADPNLN